MMAIGSIDGVVTPTSSGSSSSAALAPPAAPAGPSSSPPSPAPSAHGSSILASLFQKGFREGRYHDVVLHAPGRSYRLHRLILSSSPVLNQLLEAVPPAPGLAHPHLPIEIHVPYHGVPPGLISEPGMAICLSHLYGEGATTFLSSTDALEEGAGLPRSVLACAVYLQGMDDLAQLAFEKAKESICAATIHEWLLAVEPHPIPHPNATPYPPAFGPWTALLRAEVEQFLCETLPIASGVGAGREPTEELIDVFTNLPFLWFKLAMESPTWPSDSRSTFAFAKALIARRKPLHPDGEEAVVLSFGGQGGSNIHITRKTSRRPKALFKVEK